MPETKPANPPAFPCPASTDTGGDFPVPVAAQAGMSLRDYFAAKAMQTEMLTTFSDATMEAAQDFRDAAKAAGRTNLEHLGHNAYLIADAMLAAREAKA